MDGLKMPACGHLTDSPRLRSSAPTSASGESDVFPSRSSKLRRRGERRAFWEMHTLLFERQGALRTNDLIRYAKELTLDVDRFRDELKTQRYSERVRADFLAGVQNGVYGTPGLFLNGVRYDGEWGKESLRSLLKL